MMIQKLDLKHYFYVLYFFINGLFVLKYVSRIPNINEWLILSVYFIIGFWFFLNQKFFIRYLNYRFLFFGLVFIFFLLTVILNVYVDGNNLNIDRWSAMDVGIQALLNNQYPYSAIDHLGGRTSNLPTLLFIGIPFYLIGDVGFLQTFSFLIFSVVIYLSFSSYGEKVFCLLLAIFSPAYLYEIYCKSDLISNFILILFFIRVFPIEKVGSKKNQHIFFAFFITAIGLTRLVSLIILSLFGFKKFIQLNFKLKASILMVSVITSMLFLYVCFKNVEGLQHFVKHNPFALQNTQLPLAVSILLILSTLFWSLRTNWNFKQLLTNCIIFLSFAVFYSFARTIYYFGFSDSLFNSIFDITYFNIITPFLLIALVIQLKNSESLNQNLF